MPPAGERPSAGALQCPGAERGVPEWGENKGSGATTAESSRTTRLQSLTEDDKQQNATVILTLLNPSPIDPICIMSENAVQ